MSTKFKVINESFICEHCGSQVPVSSNTCRDHCPQCLYSKHLDEFPGDRNAQCGGMLIPQYYTYHAKKGYQIHYKCEKCGATRLNKFLETDEYSPDNFEELLKYTPK